MTPSIQDILAPLAPHWDRIIRRPMSDKEINDLQKQVGLPVPAPLRAYLKEVGLFQDLTMWQASAIEVYTSPAEFVAARRHLLEILPSKKAEIYPFGEDGAGNVYGLPCSDDEACRIHFVDHETATVSKRKDFTDWLASVVAKVLRGIRKRLPNDRKAWCVQFTFRNTSFEELVKLLKSAGKVKLVDADWKNPDKSPATVASSERWLELDGVRRKVGRLAHKDWESPMLSFDMREPLHSGLEHSQIRALHALFKANCPGYRLVDYGPLDVQKLEKT
jgi:hypothetical protein